MTLYRVITILLALICLAFGVLYVFVIPQKPSWNAKIPRLRVAGIILGVAALVYCAYAGCEMLPGSKWCKLFWGMVPVAAVLLGYYMDYLFARAFGGVLIILANYVIQHAFAYHCAAKPLYAIVALLWGLAGTIFLAWPWTMREFGNKCAANKNIRVTTLAASAISALILTILRFLG